MRRRRFADNASMDSPATPRTPAPDDVRAWSALWSRTTRGSIDLDGDDPLAVSLRRHWAQAVPWLASCGMVVDIGSGPAVLARHLRGSPGGAAIAALRWCCVDAAALPPPSATELWLRCLGDTDFASAAPPDGPVPALVSNFGLEYVPRPAWAAACARWLQPGGELHAVLHARDAVIDRTTRQTLDDLAAAIDEVALFARAEALLQAARTLPASPEARRTHGVAERAAYNEAVDTLKARLAGPPGSGGALRDLLTALTETLRLALSGQPDTAFARLAALAQAYADERRRLQAMRASAIDAEGCAAMSRQLVGAGFEPPDWQRLDSAAGMVGWTLRARRAA